jgi:hypothetical protein
LKTPTWPRASTTTCEILTKQEPFLQPWQFFLLGGMLAATATVIVATGQAPANIIILSFTVVTVSFVGLGAYRILLPLVTSENMDAPPLIGGRTRIALEREKQLVLRSLKELEFDFAMRKLSQVDYDEMSHRLRARAFGLMKQLDASGGYRDQIEDDLRRALGAPDAPDARDAQDAPDARQRVCDSCDAVNDLDARFCKSCGAKL